MNASIADQIAGLRSLLGQAELESRKLTDYKIKSSSAKARKVLNQLSMSTKQLRNDLLEQRKSIPKRGSAPSRRGEAMPVLDRQQSFIEEPVEMSYEGYIKEGGYAPLRREEQNDAGNVLIDEHELEPPVEEPKRRGRKKKVTF